MAGTTGRNLLEQLLAVSRTTVLSDLDEIVIFPQIPDLPLMGLDELKEKMPEVGDKLGPGNTWTMEAEETLFEQVWQDNGSSE